MDAKQEFSIKTIPPTAYVFSRHMVLGKGTFGEVYLGFDQQNKISVSVKMIPLEKLYQIPKIINLLPSKPRPSITHQALIRYRLGTLATIRRDNSQLSNGILCACNSRSPNNGFYCFKKKNIRLLNN